MKKPKTTKTYILELMNGNTRRVTIPATWKLSFGQLVPYVSRNHTDTAGSRVALRFYEGSKENLRAVMTDVVTFRDASISIMEKRTSVQRKNAQKQTQKGFKDIIVEARVTEWVDPDAEEDTSQPNEFLQLTDDTEF